MQPHELLRIAHDRSTHLRQRAEHHRNLTLARAARADALTSRARFRTRVAAALRAVAERLDPSRDRATPEPYARRPRSA